MTQQEKPSEHSGSPATRIIALFIPEAWINDNAVEIDGRKEVDVTEEVLALSAFDIQNLADRDYTTEVLVDLEALGHDGPFSIEVEQSIRDFFGVENLSSDVTDAMVAKARTEYGIVVAPSLSSMPAKTFYVWHGEGQCDNSTPDLSEARRIARDLRAAGHEGVYIVDESEASVHQFENGEKLTFNSTASDGKRNVLVEILRPLTLDEAEAEAGLMYKIRFVDDMIEDAFEDELSRSGEDALRPETLVKRLRTLTQTRTGSVEGETPFGADLAGYAAQAAARELVDNWADALLDRTSGHLAGDIDDVISVLIAFKNRATEILRKSDAQSTDVRKTVLQFTVLHDGGHDLADLSVEQIGRECTDGSYVGGNLMVVSDERLSREDLEIESGKLGSDAGFFLINDGSDLPVPA